MTRTHVPAYKAIQRAKSLKDSLQVSPYLLKPLRSYQEALKDNYRYRQRELDILMVRILNSKEKGTKS